MRKRALRIRIVFGSKCACVSIAIHFAVGRIGLRVHVLREEQRAMPAYEEPPVLPGGSFSSEQLMRSAILAMIGYANFLCFTFLMVF